MAHTFPLISVIVPIYGVEKYLRQCLDSLAAQTYPNFEVILMDDGSRDNCPQICDEYAAKDKRFRAIHQTNAGSAATRLHAVKAAQGKLLAFVDGDDWVEPEYLTYLSELRAAYKADISVCAPFGMGSLYMWRKKPLVKDVRESIQIMYTDKFYAGYVWNKLYPKTLWEDVQLPLQNMFEDLYFNSQIFPKTNKIVFSSKRLYHYRIVQGSLSHQGFNTGKLFLFELTEKMKQWALSRRETKVYCWITNVQLMAYLRNWVHYLRSTPKTEALKVKLEQTRPSLSWYFKWDKCLVYKWFGFFWLLTDHLIEDIYAVFFRKRDE